VHDSDGLALWNGRGEWLWRPLINPETLQISEFVDDSPRGFGLLQRRRAFADFQDLEAQYERRPSLWVEPIGHWGSGTVQLIEIPSSSPAQRTDILPGCSPLGSNNASTSQRVEGISPVASIPSRMTCQYVFRSGEPGKRHAIPTKAIGSAAREVA
jgi:hypothetical protein